MATIPRAVLDYVTRQVNALSADAQSRVLRLLESIEWTPDNVADCRALVVQALQAVLPTYTDASAQAGADMYDAVRVAQVGEPMGATATSGYNPDATEGAVRAFVQDIVDGKSVEQFNRKVADRVDYELKRACNVSVAENAARDPLKPRYARIPTGAETCSFCLMLASRGFVYTSAEAASHAHSGCDCRVVQGYPGMEVDGYDPDALYSDYLDGKFGTFTNKSGGGSSTVSRSEAYRRMGEFNDRMRAASDLDELYAIGDEATTWLKSLRFSGDKRSIKNAYNTIFDLMKSTASRRHRELRADNETGDVTGIEPRSNAVSFLASQVGKKAGKHMSEWGLDPASKSDRDEFVSLTKGIIDNAEEVSTGEWRGQPGPCTFYRKGDDLVIVNADGSYVTTMKGGASNARYQRAIGRYRD